MDNILIQFPVNNVPSMTEEKALERMNQGLQKLLEIGAIKGDSIDEILVDYILQLRAGYIIAKLVPDCILDASKLNTVGSSLIYDASKVIEEMPLVNLEEQKIFSASSINERLRIAKLNPKLRLRYLVMDHKRYFKANKKKLQKNPELMNKLKGIFLSDLNALFNEVLPYIVEGKQLNTLIGVSQVTPTLSKIARDLSLAYKRALKSERSTGQIPKMLYQRLKNSYTEFLNQLFSQVYKGSGNIESTEENEVNEDNVGEDNTSINQLINK